MIDAFFNRLDVTVQHGDVGTHPETMGGAVDVKVAITIALVVTDFLTDARRKDFRAATRERIQSSVLELDEHTFVAKAVEIGEIGDLDCGKAFEMDVRADGFETTQQRFV